jgi:signal transduction histidine kinase
MDQLAQAIQEQKRANTFRGLVNGMNQMVVAIYSDLSIGFANKKWIEVVGVKELRPQQLDSYLLQGEEVFMEHFKQVVQEEEPPHQMPPHIWMENAAKQTMILEFKIVPFFELDNLRKSWAVFFTDVTKHIQAEEELKKIAEQERKLNDMKSSFVSLVSHELRTPLSVILTSSELIGLAAEKEGLGKNFFGAKFVSRINDQVDKMSQLLNDFLYVSKIESNSIIANPQQTNITALVEQIFLEYYNPWKDGRVLTLVMPQKSNSVWIDVLQIKHVLCNLINNAFKYSDGKLSPIVKVKMHAKKWSLLIIDNGIGIPTAELTSLFKPFVRCSNVGTIEGTGIGLMIVKYFIELNNGSIRVRSSMGRGTAFIVTFNNNFINHN